MNEIIDDINKRVKSKDRLEEMPKDKKSVTFYAPHRKLVKGN